MTVGTGISFADGITETKALTDAILIDPTIEGTITLDGNVAMSGGALTNTSQPAFLAFVNTTTSNQTGNGGSYDIVFNTEVFDQGGNYDATTGVFTAPVAGKYQFNVTINFTGNTATGLLCSLVTSNRTYRGVAIRPSNVATAGGDCQLTYSFLCDMDAADTALVRIVGSGMAGNTAGVYGSASPQNTVFSGFLAC